MRIVLGLNAPNSGSILVDGKREVGDMTGPQIPDILSRVPSLEIAPEDYGDLDSEQLVFQQRAQQWADWGTVRHKQNKWAS